MDRYLKTFLAIMMVSMLTIGMLTPAMAVSSKAYSFEDNLEVALPSVAYEQSYVPGEILVKFNPGVSEAKIAAMNSKNGATVTYTSPYAGFKILKIPKTKSVEEMVEIYSKNPNVESTSANYIMHAAMVPNDPGYTAYQWNFYSQYGINVTEAWNTSNGSDVVVAVLDTGVAYEDYAQNPVKRYYLCPDLNETIFVAGYDFVNRDSHPNDDDSHGTHVTGTIAQSTNNGYGFAGVAFGCKIMPVKVLGPRGGTVDQLIDGIRFATDNGADVISMSLGFSPSIYPGPELDAALDYAYNHGVTIVAAAGNDETDKVSYPAAYEKCIAVGATTISGDLAPYSNYGQALDIVAPGGYYYKDDNDVTQGYGIVQVTFNPNTRDTSDFGYWGFTGTSMATPHVSGIAALLISSGITGPDNVREAIQNTTQDINSPGWDLYTGYGIVDAYAALNYFDTDDPVTNEPLVANFEYTTQGLTVTFNDTSISADGITDWSWDFENDGTVDSSEQNITHTYALAGTYTVNLTITEVDSDLASTTQEITVFDQPTVDGTMLSSIELTGDWKKAGKNYFTWAIATVKIVDDSSNTNPLQNAEVRGYWEGNASDSEIGSTDASGYVTFQSDSYKASPGTFTFTIDSVTREGYTYDAENSDEVSATITVTVP